MLEGEIEGRTIFGERELCVKEKKENVRERKKKRTH
jgi:hypothetical protein